MIKDYTKVFLFLSSYIPLFIILGMKNYSNSYILIGLSILVAISLIFLIYIICKAHKMNGVYKEINSYEDKSNQFLEYIIAYIIPFLGFNLNNIIDLISVGIIFLIISVLYIKSDLIYMNPILNFMGYNLYKVEDKQRTMMIITKKEILKRTKLRVYNISSKLGVAK